ncbi:hypothetical protein GNI_061200 [Gregarina niphandrodes]|uniref:Uncharacterized protein n=1 Tax=Gregarina niphandrodes TaxID=110365 RepID=A0A023B8G2_GRENI|nr:hypothetical protein GNI_061200 [Gregarina niphandrodes]EZG68852.1 hypothetical protein GNI_061200 [Gregarina niphandrodes]|eukprot:XP_011134546.1 hypothetical protein GNI_061200 [Gregarina niphandrodes]
MAIPFAHAKDARITIRVFLCRAQVTLRLTVVVTPFYWGGQMENHFGCGLKVNIFTTNPSDCCDDAFQTSAPLPYVEYRGSKGQLVDLPGRDAAAYGRGLAAPGNQTRTSMDFMNALVRALELHRLPAGDITQSK